jgi:hypothetical protein
MYKLIKNHVFPCGDLWKIVSIPAVFANKIVRSVLKLLNLKCLFKFNLNFAIQECPLLCSLRSETTHQFNR